MSNIDDSYFNCSNDTDQEIRVRDEYHYIFTTKSIRDIFIRKVYGVLLVQLCFTLGIICFFIFYDPVGNWIRGHPGIVVIVDMFAFMIVIALTCCGEGLRRKTPGNIICFFVFTLALGGSIGVTATNFHGRSVILSVGMTMLVCMAVILFTCQGKVDFMGVVGYLLAILVVCSLFGLLSIFNCHRSFYSMLSISLASLFALLFCLYLIYDTQMIVGGRQECSILPDEYIYATLSLYLDIITIFLNLLCIFGSNGDD